MAFVRRVVTGHDADGRAVFLSDGVPPKTIDRGAQGVSEVLVLPGPPGDATSGGDSPDPGFPLHPVAGGATVRVIRLPPPAPGVPDDERWLRVAGDDPQRPGMHTTDTLDFEVIMDGEIVLDLEDGEHLLHAGDVVVQRGTPHRWRVSGDRPCTYLAVMVRPDQAAATAKTVTLAARKGNSAGSGSGSPASSSEPGASSAGSAASSSGPAAAAASGPGSGSAGPGSPVGSGSGAALVPRRLVTGTDREGRSYAELDGHPAVVLQSPGPHGVGMSDLWQTGGPLSSVAQGGDAEGWQLEPIGGGMAFRMVELSAGHDPGDAGWHTTETIDVDLILSGSMELSLPDIEPVVLEAGSVVIQRGTRHRWRPVGDQPARMAAVMFGLG
ncbi:MAG TPA: cupin domain-containing protein [Acidimicrobiales bacterium]